MFTFSTTHITQETTLENVRETSGKIIIMMREDNTVTIPEIAKALNKTERAIEMQINALKKKGRIKRIGSAKGGHWEVLK